MDTRASRCAIWKLQATPYREADINPNPQKGGYPAPDRVTFLTGANRDFPNWRRQAIVDCCAWANRNLCETGSAANVRAARTCGAVDRLVTPPEVCANLDRGCGVLRDRWTMVAVLVVVRLTMAFQFQSVAAVARLSGSEFGVILADTRNPIGLCFTPSLALALPAVRSGEGSATEPL